MDIQFKTKEIFKAFTLAEVLIVLGIIGVVAALTIPTLIKNSQNTELKTAFKKTYANLNNAYNEITSENGGIPYGCYYNSIGPRKDIDCNILFSELIKKLKIIKTYTGAVDGVNIGDYTASDVEGFQGTILGSTCSGSRIAQKANKTALTFLDGSMIISYFGGASSWTVPLVMIDTNGIKKPNKWGYDIFMLNFKNMETSGYKIKIDDSVCGVYETGGYRINDILLNK